MADADIIAPPTLRVTTPKPRMTVYYALLIIALVAMLTACIFLYMVIRTFGGFGTVQGSVASVNRSHNLFYHEGHEEHEATKIRICFVPFVPLVAKS